MTLSEKIHYLPIKLRLIVSMVCLVLVVTVGNTLVTVFFDMQHLKKQLIGETEIANRVLAQDFVNLLLTDKTEVAANIVSKLKSFPMILQADLRNEQGTHILHFNRSPIEHTDPKIIFRETSLFDKERLFIPFPIVVHSKQRGLVQYVISTQKIDNRLRVFFQTITLTIFGGIIFAVLGAMYLQRFFTKPLTELTKKTAQITSTQKYNLRFEENKADKSEFGNLRKSFNNMLSQIERAHQMISGQKERLEVTLNSIGDAAIVTDTKGCITSMNPVAVRLTGWPLAKAKGKNSNEVFQIFDTLSGSTLDNPVIKVLIDDDVTRNTHATLLSQHGTQYQITDSAAPIKDKNNKILGAILVFRDISEQYKQRRRIEENEERFRLTLDIVSDGGWDWNIKTDEVFYSDKWIESLGYRRDEVPANISFRQNILHPDDKQHVSDSLHAHFENHTVRYDVENRLRMKSGEYRFNRDRGQVIERDEKGKPLRMVGADTNITQQKNSLSDLLFKQFSIDNVHDAIYWVNSESKFIDVNETACRKLGYTREELLKMHVPDLHTDFLMENWESHWHEWKTKGSSTFESHHITKDGLIFPIEITVSYFCYEGKESLCAFVSDITERKKAEIKLTHQASHDSLTGLINRREFERRTQRLLSSIKNDNTKHALCFMDLDQFKVVNDTCGHSAGDELLRQLTSALQSTVRHRDTLARLGGDEFGVLMEHCSLDQAYRVAAAILKGVQDYQFSWEGHSFKIGVSLGLVEITEDTTNLSEILMHADAACYAAKDSGRNRIHVYRPDDTNLVQRQGEMQWVARIHQALNENKFCLYAQTILSLRDDVPGNHYELLIRMTNDDGNIIPPGAFLPAAERYNVISKIDRWVIETAFSQLENNPNFMQKMNFFSINLSGQSLAEQDFLDFVLTTMDKSTIDAEKICFEITETAAIANLGIAVKFISTLKTRGCLFALDDFGSGLSSFGYLKNLQVDYLKIDGMFVKDIVDDPIDYAMVKSINEIGQVMGLQTIAEFVENDKITGLLSEIGVNYVQGYGVGKPKALLEILNG